MLEQEPFNPKFLGTNKMIRVRGQCLSWTVLSVILLSGIQYLLLVAQTRQQQQWTTAADESFFDSSFPLSPLRRVDPEPTPQYNATTDSFNHRPLLSSLSQNQPLNILILYPDDWKHDSLQDEKPDLIHTPFLSQLASEGIRFIHNAVTSSVCWLSRATLFTGRYASQHKSLRPMCPVFTDLKWWKETWPYLLQQKAGYYVGHVGKWQYRNDQAFLKNAFNWSRFHEGDHWHILRHNVTRKKLRKVHAADMAQDDAIQFLRDRPKHVPFAMTVAFYPPKAVGSFTEPGAQWSPVESFYELYKDHHFIPPYNFTQAFEALPHFLKQGIGRNRYEQRYNTTFHYEEGMKRYYALVSHVDQAAMHIIEELKRQGVYDQTSKSRSSCRVVLCGAATLNVYIPDRRRNVTTITAFSLFFFI
jgi:Sulfatase